MDNKDKYETILLRVPKGMREAIKICARNNGMSVNTFIVAAIYNQRGFEFEK